MQNICNTHNYSLEVLSQMHCNIFKGTSIILEHKGRVKIKFMEQGDMKMVKERDKRTGH